MVAQDYAGDFRARVHGPVGVAAVAVGVAANVVEAADGRPGGRLMTAALTDDLGQTDALAALAGQVRSSGWRRSPASDRRRLPGAVGEEV